MDTLILRASDGRASPAGPGPTVVIIDSGVHASHPHVQGVAGGAGIDDHGGEHADFVDRIGHGTAVTAVIREKAPHAEVWALKVFDRELAATGVALLAAMQWARTHAAHIINLSLGTTNAEYETALADEVARCAAAGVVIVAAAPEPGRRWLPGAIDGVVRVELDATRDRDECALTVDAGGQVTIRASGYPRPVPGVPPERNLKGVSFAVANAAGLLAAAWPRWPAGLSRRPDKSL